MQYGHQTWSLECGNMESISGWAGMNSSMERPRKERLTKKTQEVDSQIWHMHRADRKRVCPIDKHLFHMPAEQRIHRALTESSNGLNASQLHMKLGQHSVTLKAHHQDSLHHCGIKPQVKDHKSGYGQNIHLVFLEHKCNFRLALMYLKSFLTPW